MADEPSGRSSQIELDKKIVEIGSNLRGIFTEHMLSNEEFSAIVTTTTPAEKKSSLS